MVEISGSNFVPGVTAKWNGQARVTEFVNPYRLRVTLTTDNLAAPTLGTLAVWDNP